MLLLGEDEKMSVQKFPAAIEQIEERLLPGSGETDCNVHGNHGQ